MQSEKVIYRQAAHIDIEALKRAEYLEARSTELGKVLIVCGSYCNGAQHRCVTFLGGFGTASTTFTAPH